METVNASEKTNTAFQFTYLVLMALTAATLTRFICSMDKVRLKYFITYLIHLLQSTFSLYINALIRNRHYFMMSSVQSM